MATPRSAAGSKRPSRAATCCAAATSEGVAQYARPVEGSRVPLIRYPVWAHDASSARPPIEGADPFGFGAGAEAGVGTPGRLPPGPGAEAGVGTPGRF